MTEADELRRIEDAARKAGWNHNVMGLSDFIARAGELVQSSREQQQRELQTSEAQRSRLKQELATTRQELAQVRQLYNEQHDRWEELYVKDGVKRLLALKERIGDVAPDGVPLVLKRYALDRYALQQVYKASELNEEECVAAADGHGIQPHKRIYALVRALRRILAAFPKAQHPETHPDVVSFVEKIEHFAKESVKPPEQGAVSSRPDLVHLAMEELLLGLMSVENTSTFDDVHNVAAEAMRILRGK